MTVVTRFAPSPTGFLHIGGARTALFNWLHARHHGGTYLLRIEDTDRARSTPEAVSAILDGLSWLGLMGDAEPVFQSAQIARHVEVAEALLAAGKAYHCYCTPEELVEMRERSRKSGGRGGYDGTWRDRDPAEAPDGIPPVVRIKAPREGEITIQDAVQGKVTVKASQLDDMILLRADGTPTYMLSVVVDDHDMGVTDVIRGDDHLNNAFRQQVIFEAMGWDVPKFAHIPLIHGPDGAKMSKRHGAIGVDAYRDQGYLPDAIFNYLLRLGWSHGDDEVINRDQAVSWFGFDAVGKGPSRFDFGKLDSLNAHYLREMPDGALAELVLERLELREDLTLHDRARGRIEAGMPGLKSRAKTLVELTNKAGFYASTLPLSFDEKAQSLVEEGRSILEALVERLAAVDDWTEQNVEDCVRGYAEDAGLKLGKAAQPLRAALTGAGQSPGIFEVLIVLGKDESLARVHAVCGTAH